MKREVRKQFRLMVEELNSYFPGKQHGYKIVYKTKLVKDRIELYEIDYSGKKGKGKAKKIDTLIEPVNGDNIYRWEDMLKAFLIGCRVPVAEIFKRYQDQMQKVVEDKLKKNMKEEAIREQKAIKEEKQKPIVEGTKEVN